MKVRARKNGGAFHATRTAGRKYQYTETLCGKVVQFIHGWTQDTGELITCQRCKKRINRGEAYNITAVPKETKGEVFLALLKDWEQDEQMIIGEWGTGFARLRAELIEEVSAWKKRFEQAT